MADDINNLPTGGLDLHPMTDAELEEIRLDAYGRPGCEHARGCDTNQCKRLLAEVERLRVERDEARKDAAYHADCRPNRRQAEAALADAKALADWRADVTVALQRPGGAHFADVRPDPPPPGVRTSMAC